MFKNKKEHSIFILMICTTMVFLMSCYNVAVNEGISSHLLIHALLGFPLAFIYALIGDIFIVGKFVKKILDRILKPNDSMAKVGILTGVFSCCFMVLWMSVFGVFMNIGITSNFFYDYIKAISLNFIMAMPLNVLIVSPLIRFLFFKMFPPINDDSIKFTS